jgi:type IV secretory pathway VirD2 relaxase
MQRVSVKTYFFSPEKRGGFISYIQQEGKGKEGEAPELFTENGKDLNDALNTEYPQEERFYKVILSPENGDKLDMERYTKDFMKNLEMSEGRDFKWAATVHYDTEHPHAHILIRGIDEAGKDVSFSRDTISRGMRGQASKLATMELGNRTEMEIARQKEKELTAERFTALDRKLKEKQDKNNTVRPESREEKARLAYLSNIGLAEKRMGGSYTLDEKFDQKLKWLQRDNDILKTVYGKDAEQRDFALYRKG